MPAARGRHVRVLQHRGCELVGERDHRRMAAQRVDVGQRFSAPEGERPLIADAGCFRFCHALRVPDRPPEGKQVKLVLGDQQPVSGRVPRQQVRAEHLPEPADVGLHDAHGGHRRQLAPQHVDDRIEPDRRTGRHGKQREHNPLAVREYRRPAAAKRHRQRTQDTDTEPCPLCTISIAPGIQPSRNVTHRTIQSWLVPHAPAALFLPKVGVSQEQSEIDNR